MDMLRVIGRMRELPFHILDLLLVMVAAPRVVHRDGIRFQGLRYLDPTLAPYVGEPVTIRYDPRDLGEIRVFHRNRFLCRAISTAYAGDALTLADIQTARAAHRRALRAELKGRAAVVAEYLPLAPRPRLTVARPPEPAAPAAASHEPVAPLRIYQEDKR